MKNMNNLYFGTAGIPNISNNTIDGIQTVKRLDLGSMELEFVRSINVAKDKAPIQHHPRHPLCCFFSSLCCVRLLPLSGTPTKKERLK